LKREKVVSVLPIFVEPLSARNPHWNNDEGRSEFGTGTRIAGGQATLKSYNSRELSREWK
jgi:hypothetical protein